MEIGRDIQAYEQIKNELESTKNGQWVLIYDAKLIGTFDSFELAAVDAVKKYGAGPYLIRQIGAPPITLPASVMYKLFHGRN